MIEQLQRVLLDPLYLTDELKANNGGISKVR
jgi:hypothetical protein